MALTAARILLPSLCFCLEQLVQKQAARNLQQSCESVIDATSIFTILEGELGPTKSSDLDALLALAHSISLQDEEMGARPIWLGPSYEDLKLVQEEYYGLLRSIQGFLSSLHSPSLDSIEKSNKYGISLPGLHMYCWPRLQMPRRASEIEQRAAVCRNMRKQIQDCRDSRNRNSTAKQTNVERRKALAEVRTLQLSENVLAEHPGTIILRILSAKGLKKTGTFTGSSSPIWPDCQFERQSLIIARPPEYLRRGANQWRGPSYP